MEVIYHFRSALSGANNKETLLNKEVHDAS